MTPSAQLTVRFPSDVRKGIDQHKKGSSSEYIVEAVREKIERDRQSALYEGFALLADDPSLIDMRFPTGAQTKAAKVDS